MLNKLSLALVVLFISVPSFAQGRQDKTQAMLDQLAKVSNFEQFVQDHAGEELFEFLARVPVSKIGLVKWERLFTATVTYVFSPQGSHEFEGRGGLKDQFRSAFFRTQGCFDSEKFDLVRSFLRAEIPGATFSWADMEALLIRVFPPADKSALANRGPHLDRIDWDWNEGFDILTDILAEQRLDNGWSEVHRRALQLAYHHLPSRYAGNHLADLYVRLGYSPGYVLADLETMSAGVNLADPTLAQKYSKHFGFVYAQAKRAKEGAPPTLMPLYSRLFGCEASASTAKRP